MLHPKPSGDGFLSIQAQDFIEESVSASGGLMLSAFLSIQAQDFIEENPNPARSHNRRNIPEHSSSGLH